MERFQNTQQLIYISAENLYMQNEAYKNKRIHSYIQLTCKQLPGILQFSPKLSRLRSSNCWPTISQHQTHTEVCDPFKLMPCLIQQSGKGPGKCVRYYGGLFYQGSVPYTFYCNFGWAEEYCSYSGDFIIKGFIILGFHCAVYNLQSSWYSILIIYDLFHYLMLSSLYVVLSSFEVALVMAK